MAAHPRKPFFVRAAEAIARAIYRLEVHGVDRLPEGGFLLLPNHLSWVDAVVLHLAMPRPVRFVMVENIYRNRWLHPFFRSINVIPISGTRAKEAVATAAAAIRAGDVVCLFPEGELSRSGMLLKLKRGFELIARQADAPVVPVWLDQLWGSIFSFAGGKYFTKIPRHLPYPVSIAFGAPIPAAEAEVALVRERLLELGAYCYERRPMLRSHLGRAAVAGLKKRQFDLALTDGLDDSTISRGMLLAAAIVLARHLREHCPNARVAVVLPPGKGAIIANLAVLLAGKVPVNLNFTAGQSAIEAAIRIAQIEDAISALAFARKFQDFPWPRNVLHLEKIMPGLKKKIPLVRALVAITPARWLCAWLKLPQTGDRQEAVILFTSGSSGEPKGVVLSHRNLLGNISQFGMMLNLTKDDTLLAVLPFFHSFGCTVTLWYPLVLGVRAVTYPSPLEIGKNAELIARHGVSLLIATPTFLRGYLRKATPEQMTTLKLVVTGAEKLPRDLAEAFRERFGIAVMEGYGLTETSPVAAVNLPEPPAPEGANVQPSARFGSVGKLAPGMAAQIRHPESGEALTLHETGMLWLRGPNIFEGYLNDPKRTAEAVVDAWFKTGDLARFDEDGFLFIEGRVSRFSKIAGEMVPHETLEARIVEVMGWEGEDERIIAVTSVPDEAKGEAIALLSTREIDLKDLRAKLNEAGIPNLWVPKKLVRVEAIPALASGKMDLKACQQAALEASEASPSRE